MTAPDISIIVPVYNTGERLPRCLDSLLAQCGVTFELIIINDGSADNSADVAAAYRSRYPEIITFLDGANAGVSVARNRGLDAARGRWIYFCDSDDYAEPDICAYLLQRAESTGADMACCALICDRSAGAPDIRMAFPCAGERVMERPEIITHAIRPLLRLGAPGEERTHGYLPLAIFRRSIIEANHLRFIPGLIHAQDEAFYLQYIQYVSRLALSDRILYHYVMFENSTCTRLLKRREASFFVMEKCAYLRSECRRATCEKHRLEQYFPGVYPQLAAKALYHRLQMDANNSEMSWRERVKVFAARCRTEGRELAAAAAAAPLPFFLRIFVSSLFCGAGAAWILCAALKTAKAVRARLRR